MREIFAILAGLGCLMMIVSVFCLKPGLPFSSIIPRMWIKPIWKAKDIFNGPGYYIGVIGYIWVAAGAVGYLVTILF